MNLVLSEDLVVVLLVLLCRGEGLDLLYGNVELRRDACKLLFLHLEHVCPVGLVRESLIDIDIELVADLCSGKLGLCVAGHIPDSHIGALDIPALLGEINDHEILLACGLGVNKRAELAEKIVLHLLLGDIAHLNAVVRNLVVLAEFEVYLGSSGNVKLECEVIAGLPLELCLVCARKRLTHHLDIVVLYEAVDGVRENPVDRINQNPFTVNLLYQ